MSEPLILLDKKIIKQNLINKDVDLDVLSSIDSTNKYLQKFSHDKRIKICIAEEQTQGKGRFDRNWYSPFGQNVYFSCLYPFRKDINELAGLSLIISLAGLKTLNVYEVNKQCAVKWPNDIIYQDKKLVGCLIEIQTETDGISCAIIGIGMNVNMLHDENSSISQNWTSLRKILGRDIDRNYLCAALINNLMLYLAKFVAQGFCSFIEEWNRADGLFDRSVMLQNIDGVVNGQVKGVDYLGRLLLKLSDDTIQAFSSGDTTIA